VNLKALGVGQVSMIGVVGDDPFGDWIHRLLAGAGIETTGVLVQPAGWATQVFVKPHEQGSELSRIDLGNWNELTDRTRRELLGHIKAALPRTDFVVINEQALRGIHSSSAFRKGLLEILRSHAPGRAIIDSRHYIDEFSGIMRKLNAREAARILGEPDVPTEYLQAADLHRLAARLSERWQVPLALTAGDRGSMAATGRGVTHVEAIRLSGSLDPVGAGDAFLAGLAGGLSARLDFLAAVQLGTLAAAVTVRKLRQPGTATSSEILALADEATA
jgi:sugar/nucleoside kinase (ribokinase family)